MGENLSHSSNSTLTSNSDVTDCANSATKRNRDWLSNSDSRRPLPMAIDLDELFRQLVFARLARPPYEKFKGWRDYQLWCEIAKALNERNIYCHTSASQIIELVMEYQQHYARDPTLCKVKDCSLRNNIFNVFGLLSDAKGRLKIEDLQGVHKRETRLFTGINPLVVSPFTGINPRVVSHENSDDVCDDVNVVYWEEDFTGRKELIRRAMERRQSIIPSTSNELESQMLKVELGFTGALSALYMEDVEHLQLNKEEKGRLLLNYGPTSSQYIVISNSDAAERRDFLRMCLDEVKQSSSRRVSSASSREKRKL